ncbi:HU family DNA-binding protein [Agrobacterium vitis]|uniref:HU family DNA-binding protein n=1 Tax=Agrobacterium vitis TaxID=373 RepID=UPI001F196F29|nr:HU family DNA-binding protein [Agrobacterium vitis]
MGYCQHRSRMMGNYQVRFRGRERGPRQRPTSSLPDFKVKASPEREGRNPATGEKMTVAASKKLTFAPAKALKDALNK